MQAATQRGPDIAHGAVLPNHIARLDSRRRRPADSLKRTKPNREAVVKKNALVVRPEASDISAWICPGQWHPEPEQEGATDLDVTTELRWANPNGRNVTVSMGANKHPGTEQCSDVTM